MALTYTCLLAFRWGNTFLSQMFVLLPADPESAMWLTLSQSSENTLNYAANREEPEGRAKVWHLLGRLGFHKASAEMYFKTSCHQLLPHDRERLESVMRSSGLVSLVRSLWGGGEFDVPDTCWWELIAHKLCTASLKESHTNTRTPTTTKKGMFS